MRIIPRKIKVRNNVWKCYSMKDILFALGMFALIFVCVTAGVWWLVIVLALLSIVMFMPTGDGIFYSYIAENVRFLFSRKRFDENSKKMELVPCFIPILFHLNQSLAMQSNMMAPFQTAP